MEYIYKSNNCLHGLETVKVIVGGGIFVVDHGRDFEFSPQVLLRMKLSEAGRLLVLKLGLFVAILEEDGLGSGILEF